MDEPSDEIASSAQGNALTTAARLAALLTEKCVQGDAVPLERVLQDYERRVETLENDNVARLTAVMEAEALQQLLADERSRSANVKRQLEVLIFRTTYSLTCKLTEDEVPDNPQLSLEQQAQVIIRSFELGDIPVRTVETDDIESRAEAVLALHNQFMQVRDQAKLIRAALHAQVVERLHLKRAFDKLHLSQAELEKEVDNARRSLTAERELREKSQREMKKQVNEYKDRAAKLETRLFTEVEALRKSFQEREEKLEQSNQKMATELERLRTVERRLLRTETDLEQARKTSQELRNSYNEEAKKVSQASNLVRVAVLKELRKCAAQFDALPLEMKMGDLTSRTAASEHLENEELLGTGRGTDALTDDLKEHFLALNATVVYMSKLLEEKAPPEVLARVVEERERLREISETRKQVNALLFRCDTKELGPEVSDAVDEYVVLEKKMKKLRTSVRRSITLGSVQTVDTIAALEDELDDAEAGVVAEADAHGLAALGQTSEALTQSLLEASANMSDSEMASFSAELRQRLPELRASLTEKQVQLLFNSQRRSVGGDGGTGSMAALDSSDVTNQSSILAGHASPPPSQRIAALLASIHRSSGAGTQLLQQQNLHEGGVSAWGNVGEASSSFGAPLVLPPIRRIRNEAQQATSKIFGDVATFATEVAVARDDDASSLLKHTDEQRLLNLKTCLAVLDNAQKEYAKTKGIRLPPLDNLPELDPDSEIGRPLVRGVGGPISGKLWRAQRAAQAVKPKRKPKLSVQAASMQKPKR